MTPRHSSEIALIMCFFQKRSTFMNIYKTGLIENFDAKF